MPDNQAENKLSKKELRQQAAEKRNQLKSLRNKATTLEKQINNNQVKLVGLEAQLADASLYDDGQKDKLNNLLLERAALVSATEALEEQWLEASEMLEQADSQK